MSAVDPSQPPSEPEPETLAAPISGRPDLGRVPWADHRDPLSPVPAPPPAPAPAGKRPHPPGERGRSPRLQWDRRTVELRDEGMPYALSIPLTGATLDHRAGLWIARGVNTLYAQTISATWTIVLVAAARPEQRLLVFVHRPPGTSRPFDEAELRRYLDDTFTLLPTAAGHLIP